MKGALCQGAFLREDKEDYRQRKNTRKTLYKPGETIVHPHYGVGTVESIQDKEILGSKAVFATLRFHREELTMIVPQKQLDELARLPLTRSEAKEVLTYLTSWNEGLSTSWKVRKSKNHERLTSGDPKQLCVVAKGLILLQKEKGRLATSDIEQLDRSISMLADELSSVLGYEFTPMRERIEKLCRSNTAA